MTRKRVAITAAKVLVLLQRHGAQTPHELAMRLGWGVDGIPTVESRLAELVDEGLIRDAATPAPSWAAVAQAYDEALAESAWQNAD